MSTDNMMSESILRRVGVMSHVTNRPPWSRGETKNTWTDRTGVRMSEGLCTAFVGCTDSVGRIVAWLVCGWIDRQGTSLLSSRHIKSFDFPHIYSSHFLPYIFFSLCVVILFSFAMSCVSCKPILM